MNKKKTLQKLRVEIEHCLICKSSGTGKLVFGEGDPDAKVVFVGEAPGKKEAETGRPFVGRSGQLLRETMRTVGLQEEGVYITSPVKFLPNRGTPSKSEIIHSNVHFEKQLKIINPKVVVLLGKTAVHAVLNEDIPILKDHGRLLKRNHWDILITLHPAAVLRFPKYASIFQKDFMKLKRLIKE